MKLRQSALVALLICSASALASGCAASPRPAPSQIPAGFLEAACELPDPASIDTVGELEAAYVAAWRCARICEDAREALQ